jgi:serine/threonine protein kinase
MSRVVKPPAIQQASVEAVPLADVVLLNVSGLVDERFTGFGSFGNATSLVINVAGITRMTSFGVRQWLKAMDALPKKRTELFLLGCPTVFVDQLNMVLNFGGAAKVLTVAAPYTCTSCGVESGESIDVLAERTNLANGVTPEKQCARCGGKLEFDESPESYFAFVNKYGATTIDNATAQALALRGLYSMPDTSAEKPPRIIKLVNDAVTYFRIIGRIGSLFRARPFLVGAEGEVVIDLHEVESYSPSAMYEWRRLLKNLSSQVTAVTLVDVRDSFVSQMGDTLTFAKNVGLASLLVRYVCSDCDATSYEGEMVSDWAGPSANVACECGGTIRADIGESVMAQVRKTHWEVPSASRKVISQRAQLLELALNDAQTQAQTSDTAPPSSVGKDDAILGKYKIVRRLPSGPGAIADTFFAKQVGIGGFEKPVVLKKFDRTLLEQRQQSVELLLFEVKSAGRLTHANIVQVLDVGEVQDALYVALEYVNGKSLDDIIAAVGGPLPIAEAIYIAREIAQALDHAFASTDMAGHQLRVVHGDIGPNNIMLSYDGAVKVLDFGVMMAMMKTSREAQYMAPEAAVEGAYGHASDIFSLGILIYKLCAGSTPFTGTGTKNVVKKMRTGKFRGLEEFAGVPPALAGLVARMISFDPASRPHRAQEVVAALTEIVRRDGLERSPPAVGGLVTRLFPVSDVAARPSGEIPIPAVARSSSRRMSTPAETRPSREISAPPIGRTSSRGFSGAIPRRIGRQDAERAPGIDESAPIGRVDRSARTSRPWLPPQPQPALQPGPAAYALMGVLIAAIAAVTVYFLAPMLWS